MKLKFIYLKLKKMKKIYSIVLVVLLSFTVKESVAQTDIHLFSDSCTASTTFSCQKNVNFYFHVCGFVSGYNPSLDTIRIKVFFGDGTDTIYKTNLDHHTPVDFFYLYASKYHNYSDTGVYNIKFKAIAPDNKADSAVQYNFIVGDNCGIIKGYVYNDVNNNCTFNLGDGPIANQTNVILKYGNQLVANYNTYPADSSRYYFLVPLGFNYNVSLQNNFNLAFCPGFYNLSSSGAHKDFGFNCNSNQFDISGTISGAGHFTPGTSATINCMAFNLGCTAVSGKLKLLYDNSKLNFVSASGTYSLVGDTVIWDFTNIDNYNLSGNNLTTTANFTVLTTVNNGEIITYKLTESPVVSDANPQNNIQIFNRTVGASYDPNDKTVIPLGEGVQGFVHKNLNMIYTIRFQNTGTAYAENIYIIDSIDNNLDINSLTLLNHSHNPQITFSPGRVVKFNYPNIFLPDSNTNYNGSMGFVQFAIKQNNDLAEGVQINNNAYIYFDYNAPVKTNTVLNTINYTVGAEESKIINENFSLYPNPNKGIFSLQFENLTGKAVIEVYNITGQLVLSNELINSLIKTIDLSGQAKGVYLLKVKTDNYTSSEKIILE